MNAHQSRNSICDPIDVSLKSTFLGPQAENSEWVGLQIQAVFQSFFDWRKSLFPEDGRAITSDDQDLKEFRDRQLVFKAKIQELQTRFEAEIPKFSPRYIGHMFSETSLPALFGHITTLLHNPNNISGESSRVGTQLEDEALQALAQMLGLNASDTAGHFTSGGTIANFEALVRARARMAKWLARAASNRNPSNSLFQDAHLGWDRFDLLPAHPQEVEFNWIESNPWEVGQRLQGVYGTAFRGPVALIPQNKHYSWIKGVSLLGLGECAFWPVRLNEKGTLSTSDLKAQLERAEAENRPVLMVVSVAGTTEMGHVDAVDEVQEVLDKWRSTKGIHIWHHVDAAFGAFFTSLSNEQLHDPHTTLALRAIPRADSCTVDPHKLGYVPYASGVFLAHRRRNYDIKSFGAPYVRFEKGISDRGPYTLEGSRPATGAAATWMIAETVGLHPEGYGRIIHRTIQARVRLSELLQTSGLPYREAPHLQTNILCFTLAQEGEPLSVTNLRMKQIFEYFSFKNKEAGFGIAMTHLKESAYEDYLKSFYRQWSPKVDTKELTLLRLTLMNPFFTSKQTRVNYADEWVDRLRKFYGTPDKGSAP